MKHLSFSALLLCAFLAPAQSPKAEKAPALPSADAVFERFVAATGGNDAHDKIQNEVAMGTMEFTGKGVKGTLLMYQAAPARSYVVIDLEGVGKIEQGTDGSIAWERSALQGPRIKTGEERASALREADIQSRRNWKKHYKSAEVAGVESINGKPCVKVMLTPNEGKPETRFFDQKTGLLIRMDVVAKSPMGEVPAETWIEDYKDIDGLLTPHRLRQKVLGQEFVTTLQSVKYNAEIPAGRFELPADVKALVNTPKK